MVRKFTKASLALLVLSGSIGLAHAANIDESNIASQRVELQFVAPLTVNHSLDAVDNLTAGNVEDETPVANGTVTAADASSQVFAVRFSPDMPGAEAVQGKQGVYSIPGHTATNTLILQLKPDLETSFDPAGGWLYANAAVASYNYTLVASGPQKVAADTYTVTMDAGIWVS